MLVERPVQATVMHFWILIGSVEVTLIHFDSWEAL
jgi:hypothetical protein